MKLYGKKLMVFILTLVLILSTFTLGANAEYTVGKDVVESAKIFGDLDLSSNRPISVIVELKEESIVEAKHNGKKQDKGNLAKVRGNVVKQVKNKVKGAKVNREYDYLFSGFSVELPANEVLQLLTVPGIKAVYPNITYTTTEVGEASIIDNEVFSPQMFNSAPYIGSNDAWDMGYTGKGITVAVIDTGVDYTHPDLAHAFGEYKGYDFVDNDNDPQEGYENDGERQHHGTHVSGTIAANGDYVKGVAPEADLLGYRVLGPDGGSTEDVVAAIELAVQDGADVMNLSLGNPLNYADWATSIALDWAMAEGVVAVTSNGNSGPDNWTVGSPGTSREAISVGATGLPYNVYSGAISTSEDVNYESSKVMGYSKNEEILGLNGNTYEFVFAGLGGADEFEGLDVTGKIALISRGGYAFVDKAENAKAAGAIGAIIFNHSPGEIPYEIPGMAVPTLKLTTEDGLKMLDELEAGNNKVTFGIDYVKTTPEYIADFSSRGPVAGTWMIKPDVSAPGVNIVSTFPDNTYASLQGTSMASPHVAGAAALILQANPSWTPEDVKSALMNTAEKLYDLDGNPYPHNTQGAGSIRIVDAINTKTLVAPGSYSFGKFIKDSGKQVEKQSFEIKNLSNKRKTYSFDVEFDGNPDGIKVMLSNNLKVQPGKPQQVNFKVQVDTSKLEPGYYEGTIEISDGTEIIDLPTILFVGEPDYPRVTGAFIEKDDEGYLVGSYLPAGAEVIEYHLFQFDAENYAIGAYIDMLGGFENAEAPYHEFEWDGTVLGGIEVPNGEWVLAVYVEKAGVTEVEYYLVDKE